MNPTPTLFANAAAGAERLASLPAAAAFLREVQAMTCPGRPLYGMAGRAAETIDQVRRELARAEGAGAYFSNRKSASPKAAMADSDQSATRNQ